MKTGDSHIFVSGAKLFEKIAEKAGLDASLIQGMKIIIAPDRFLSAEIRYIFPEEVETFLIQLLEESELVK